MYKPINYTSVSPYLIVDGASRTIEFLVPWFASAPEMHSLSRVFSYAWAAPASALGLLVALVAVGSGAKVTIVDGVVEVAGTRLARWLTRSARLARFNAITLGHVVIGVSPAVLAHCRAHERVHVRQYERFGVFLFPLYAASSGLQWVRGRSPYWENHFERQARRGSACTRTVGRAR